MSVDGLAAQGPQGQALGMVVDGSLSRGVEVRLDGEISVEDIKEGPFHAAGAVSTWGGVTKPCLTGSSRGGSTASWWTPSRPVPT